MSKNVRSGEGPHKPFQLELDTFSFQNKAKRYANLKAGPAGEYLEEHVRQFIFGEISRLKSVREIKSYLLYKFGIDASPSGIAKRIRLLRSERNCGACNQIIVGEN